MSLGSNSHFLVFLLLLLIGCGCGCLAIDKTIEKGYGPRLDIGVIGRKNKRLAWIKECPNSRYSSSFPALHMRIDLAGMTQVGDEVWICGGKAQGYNTGYDDAKSCTVLNLVNGRLRILEHKINFPRLNPIVISNGSMIMVIGGHTSDINSATGCRNTMEVFDIDNQNDGWRVEKIEENESCRFKEGERLTIKCT